MIENGTVEKGFERVLQLISDAAGLDLASNVDVSALREQFINGGSLIDWILDHVELSERDFGSDLAAKLHLAWEEDPLVDTANSEILKAVCPPPIAIKHRALILRAEFGESTTRPVLLEIAHYDPFSTIDRQMVRRAVGCPIKWVLAPRRKILGRATGTATSSVSRSRSM